MGGILTVEFSRYWMPYCVRILCCVMLLVSVSVSSFEAVHNSSNLCEDKRYKIEEHSVVVFSYL